MDWMEALSEENKSSESLKKFADIDALAKSYRNLESMQGSSIRINGPEASEEDRAATYNKVMKHMPELMLKPDLNKAEQSKEFYQMLGVPDDVDGYSSDGLELEADVLKELKILAHDSHLTREQWKNYATKMSNMNNFTKQEQEDTRVRMGAELKSEWGMAFEDRYAVAEKFINDNPGLGGIEGMSPEQIKTYYDISRRMTGTKQAFAQPDQSVQTTPQEALERIKEIRNNPKWHSSDPADRHEQARLKGELVKYMKAAAAGDR